ncbi:MAG: PCMD domain-containing protein [Bacteroidota bacterium]|nr:PCMD domain-containing protein [Bacteroidota bacterium]
MKKILLLFISLFLLNAGFSQSNVPNGNFENWYQVSVSGSSSYWQLGSGKNDNWLTTLNELASIAPPLGPGPVTVYRTDSSNFGSYAARLTSGSFFVNPTDIFIPGMLGTATLDFANIRAILGRPCAGCKPLHFTGYYQYYPVNGDSCCALALLTKWNSSSKKRDTIGYGEQVIRDAVSIYTPFDVTIQYNYPSSSLSPDTMTLLVVSSAAFNLSNFMACKGSVGSTMYIDDLMLEYPAGIQESVMPKVSVNVFPNPAQNALTMELGECVENAIAEIFNAEGKSMATFVLPDQKNLLPVNKLADGIYYYQVRKGEKILNSGSFQILK